MTQIHVHFAASNHILKPPKPVRVSAFAVVTFFFFFVLMAVSSFWAWIPLLRPRLMCTVAFWWPPFLQPRWRGLWYQEYRLRGNFLCFWLRVAIMPTYFVALLQLLSSTTCCLAKTEREFSGTWVVGSLWNSAGKVKWRAMNVSTEREHTQNAWKPTRYLPEYPRLFNSKGVNCYSVLIWRLQRLDNRFAYSPAHKHAPTKQPACTYVCSNIRTTGGRLDVNYGSGKSVSGSDHVSFIRWRCCCCCYICYRRPKLLGTDKSLLVLALEATLHVAPVTLLASNNHKLLSQALVQTHALSGQVGQCSLPLCWNQE